MKANDESKTKKYIKNRNYEQILIDDWAQNIVKLDLMKYQFGLNEELHQDLDMGLGKIKRTA